MTTGPTRLHGLDALRGGALLLGILLHALIPFTVGTEWLVKDRSTTEVADAINYTIHLFRMPLFLLLAGYFGRMMLLRRGTRPFLRDRFTRIGLPLVAFWPVAVLPLALLSMANLALRDLPAPTELPTDPLMMFTPAHLWFLLVLLECYLVTVALRAVATRLLGAERVAGVVARLAAVVTSPVGVLLVAVPYSVTLLLQAEPLSGGITAPATIRPEAIGLLSYFGAFAVGWCLHSDPDAIHRLRRRRVRSHLVAAVVLTTVGWILLDRAVPTVLVAAVMAVAAWSWVFALIGLCLRHLSTERRWVRYLADSSYWMYLIHLPLLIAVEIPLADLDLPIVVKLAATLVVTGLILLASYSLLVRRTWIGRWLTGHRAARRTSVAETGSVTA